MPAAAFGSWPKLKASQLTRPGSRAPPAAEFGRVKAAVSAGYAGD